jgi:hypothetical protein
VKHRRRSTRLTFAAWLGLAGIGVQALFPLFLAIALTTGPHHHGTTAGDATAIAIHAHHAQAVGPAPIRHDGPAAPHSSLHPHCILCLGVQAAGPLILPAGTLVPEPTAVIALAWTASPRTTASQPVPANYRARAPPSDG